MKDIERFYDMKQMINVGKFITAQQIEQAYGLDTNQTYEAVERGDLTPIRFTGRFYFLQEQVKMFALALKDPERFEID